MVGLPLIYCRSKDWGQAIEIKGLQVTFFIYFWYVLLWFTQGGIQTWVARMDILQVNHKTTLTPFLNLGKPMSLDTYFCVRKVNLG